MTSYFLSVRALLAGSGDPGDEWATARVPLERSGTPMADAGWSDPHRRFPEDAQGSGAAAAVPTAKIFFSRQSSAKGLALAW